MGPLLKHPDILRTFNPPPYLTEVPTITTRDILEAISDYTQEGKKTFKLQEIIKFLAAKYKVRDPKELCIRIRKPDQIINFIGKVLYH